MPFIQAYPDQVAFFLLIPNIKGAVTLNLRLSVSAPMCLYYPIKYSARIKSAQRVSDYELQRHSWNQFWLWPLRAWEHMQGGLYSKHDVTFSIQASWYPFHWLQKHPRQLFPTASIPTYPLAQLNIRSATLSHYETAQSWGRQGGKDKGCHKPPPSKNLSVIFAVHALFGFVTD